MITQKFHITEKVKFTNPPPNDCWGEPLDFPHKFIGQISHRSKILSQQTIGIILETLLSPSGKAYYRILIDDDQFEIAEHYLESL